MGTSSIDREREIAGVRYVGKLPVFRCKSCGSTFIEPETERDFHNAMNLVATGSEPEMGDVFQVRRKSTETKRGFWSTLFGQRAANDVERARERVR